MVGNIPNILTIARILLLPFFAATLMYEQYGYSLLLFFIASITDLLDGLTARLMNQITYFGKILDPIADKFFLITSFILLSAKNLMPMWLAIIVISRDLIVVTGCIILYLVTNSLKVEPSLLGKTASALQFILIGLILLSLNIRVHVPVHQAMFIAVAVLTTLSGLQYIFRGLRVVNSESS